MEVIRHRNQVTESDVKLERQLQLLAKEWKNPDMDGVWYAFAAEITRQAMETYRFVDLTPLILRSTTLPRNAHFIVFKDLLGYTATTVSAGGTRQAFRLKKTRTRQPIPDEFENATIELYQEDIINGNYGSVASIREGIRDALAKKKMATVLNELHTYVNTDDVAGDVDGTYGYTASGNQNYLYTGSYTLDKNVVDVAIRKDIARAGAVRAIIGHPDYLLPICDFSGFLANEATPGQKEELQRRGWIGTYRGCNVITIPEYYDDKYNRYTWDTNNVYIIGDRMGEIANIYGIEAVTHFEAMRSARFIGGDQKYVVLAQDPELRYGFRIQMGAAT